MGDFASSSATGRADLGRELVLATIAEHAASLLATARRYSLCVEDAQDAYQRGVEIFLTRAGSVQPEGAPAWLRTVIKHEALAVRAARLRLVGPAEADMDLEEARDLPGADERAASFERLERSAEALSRLKPQEVRALVLKAHGYSYEEISEITGWTYTKVNRCLTEGRRSLRDRLDDIEAGRECERWSPLLCAVADGEASAADLVRLRPHLRHCAACRATLREHRLANRRVAAVVPLAAVAGMGETADQAPTLVMRFYEAVTGGVHERATLSAQKVQAGLEAASAGKLAAVAASATALAGGGVAVLRAPVAHEADRAGHTHSVSGRHAARGDSAQRVAAPLRAVAEAGRDRGQSRRPGGDAAGRGSRGWHGGRSGRAESRGQPRVEESQAPAEEFSPSVAASSPSAVAAAPAPRAATASESSLSEAGAASSPSSAVPSSPGNSEFGP